MRALRPAAAAIADVERLLDELRAAGLMTEPVKTVTEVDTLCGLFKRLAIEGFRHMPMIDEDDQLCRVISMWHGVGMVAHRPGR